MQHVRQLVSLLSLPSPGDLAIVLMPLSALSRSACRDLLRHAGHVLVDCVQRVRGETKLSLSSSLSLSNP